MDHIAQAAYAPAAALATQRHALRQQLQALTDQPPSQQQAQHVASLAASFNGAHVRMLPTPFALAQPLYNCVMYALDLVERFEPQLQRIQGLDFRYLADTDFLHQALAQGILGAELPPEHASPGCLVLYFDGARLRHTAKYVGQGRCASKWGPGGVYEHGLWDLPLQLGSSARFARMPNPLDLLLLLRQRVPGLRLKARRQALHAPAQRRRRLAAL